ncbi:Protein priA, partial [Trametes pubescens]
YSAKSCCLPHGGVSSPPQPPSGTSCPSAWYWHTGKSCCVPDHPPTSSSPPTCTTGWTWDSTGFHCKPQATTSAYHPPTPSTTAHTTSIHTTPAPTTYHATTSTHSSPAPTTSSSSDCGSNQWYWSPKSCCLPHGGTPNPPSPPSGSSCPSNWEWHSGKSCCVPHHPDQPPPQCSSGWGWNDGAKCCNPHSTTTSTTPSKPSSKPGSGYGNGYGGSNWKRNNAKSRAMSLCPDSLEACPIMGLTGLSGDYECADTRNDIQSCGGCASTGAGQDCTTIDGAWNVGCNSGKCVVLTCAAGYKRSADSSMCIKL